MLAWLDEIAGGKIQVPFGHRPPVTRDPDGSLMIETLEGTMRAEVGDYIIRGVQGELYPCKPDIFDATYETVTASSAQQGGYTDIVFADRPGNALEFIEVEDETGASIKFGEWVARPDGYRAIRVMNAIIEQEEKKQ